MTTSTGKTFSVRKMQYELLKRGEIWFADVGFPGDRPVLVLTRDPVADRIGAVVVAHLTTTIRGLTSELYLGPADGLPTA